MKRFVLFLVVVGLSQIAEAADLVYAPQYQTGEVYNSEVEVVVDQTLTIAGMPVVTHSDQFMVIQETVEQATDAGATLVGGFDTMQTNLNIAGTMYSFNSENPDASMPPAVLEPVHELFKELSTAQWTTVIDDEGKVESMEYRDDAFANLDPALQSEVDLQKYIDEANQQAERLPGAGIEVGQTWERSEVMDLGGGQEFHIERRFTYAGSETADGRELERVDVESTAVTYSVTPNPNMPFDVDSSNLEIDSSEGAYWYDPALKTIVKTDETMHVTGDLELEIMGQVLASQLDLTITSTTTLRPQ